MHPVLPEDGCSTVNGSRGRLVEGSATGGKRPFAATHQSDRVAPIPPVRGAEIERRGFSTPSGPLAQVQRRYQGADFNH
jgi:hypothetical protein